MGMKSLRLVLVAMLLLGTSLILSGCGGGTPWLRLGLARNAHQLEVTAWSVEPAAEEGERGQVMITVNVTDTGSEIQLPCLTIDLILTNGDAPEEVLRATQELDLSGFSKGGSQEFVRMILEPVAAFDSVKVDLNRPLTDGLQSLCEAAVVEAD